MGGNLLLLPIINAMAGLVGEFEVKLDTKGRFLFPSGLRKQLAASAQRDFMLNKGFEDCLTLYPLPEWEKLSASLSKINLFNPKNRMFYRLFHQGAKQLTNLSASSRGNCSLGTPLLRMQPSLPLAPTSGFSGGARFQCTYLNLNP